jgi:hypothetical protein
VRLQASQVGEPSKGAVSRVLYGWKPVEAKGQEGKCSVVRVRQMYIWGRAPGAGRELLAKQVPGIDSGIPEGEERQGSVFGPLDRLRPQTLDYSGA